jgi:2-polyprenyl-3-methyl-5-hydroxy-6-metoxy-1,4-benzoquinol methylase
MDWTRLTKRPTEKSVEAKIEHYLLSVRDIVTVGDRTDYLVEHVTACSVLDIGACGHADALISHPSWLHGRIKRVARSLLGIDVLPADVERLRQEGFNVRCVDATSSISLGETYDRILMGDVIEHVDNPVALMCFAARHLNAAGNVLVSSPNPYYYRYQRVVATGRPIVTNLDHVNWITPANALELGRRAGLNLVRYVCFINRTRILKRKLFGRPPSEAYTSDYVYVYEHARRETPVSSSA